MLVLRGITNPTAKAALPSESFRVRNIGHVFYPVARFLFDLPAPISADTGQFRIVFIVGNNADSLFDDGTGSFYVVALGQFKQITAFDVGVLVADGHAMAVHISRGGRIDPASYPAIKTAADDLSDYDNVVIVAPLWWNNMAAPLQTFLFKYGAEMEGKRIGLIVSSGESSIEGVEADVKRLIPNGKHLNPSLWILRSRTNQCPALIEEWLATINKAQK